MKEKLKTKAFVQKEKDKLVAVASEEVEDREGEKLSVSGWELKSFKTNPVLLWGHNPTEPAVGRAENIKRKIVDGVKKLVFEPVFHGLSERSALLDKLYRADPPVLNSFSVGFLPKEREGNKYTKQELLEISCVNVPALASATVISRMKKLGIKEKEIELLTKPYPNEHSCDFGGDYDKYRRVNCEQKSGGKCIDVVYGIKGGKSEISSLRYKKEVWDAGEARKHCEGRKGKFVPASGTAQTEPKKKKEIKKPSTLPKGKKKVVSKGKQKETKSRKSQKGEPRNFVVIAQKALEKCFQEPDRSRQFEKVAYKAIEKSLVEFKKNGQKREQERRN